MRSALILMLLTSLVPGMGRAATVQAASRTVVAAPDVNFVANPGFEQASGWEPYGDGYTVDTANRHGGRRSIRCDGMDRRSVHGAHQLIVFAKPIQHSLLVRGWSRSRGADVAGDYDVYLDLHYADGTPLWGQVASFSPGRHDWEKAEILINVARPVKSIDLYVMFRQAKGTVWFDDITIELAPFEFKSLRVAPGLFGASSLAGSGSTTLPGRWDASLLTPHGVVANSTGSEMPIHFQWADLPRQSSMTKLTLRVRATEAATGKTISREETIGNLGRRPKRGYAAWVASSMERVLPNALPGPAAKGSASIALAGREYESFQVVLLGAHPLRDVSLSVSDLVGTGRISHRNISWKQVGYVYVRQPVAHPAVLDAGPGWWPDPLLPVKHFDVPAGFAQPIWITVYAEPGTRPGVYRGAVTVTMQGERPLRVPLSARIYGFDLPVRGHLKTAFALMDGYLEQVYGKPLSRAIRRRYGQYMLEHRLNPDDISRTSPPVVEDLKAYQKHGLNTFNVLNLVEERGNAAWVCYSPLSAYTPAFKKDLIRRLDPYMARIRRLGLSGEAYVHGFDERGQDYFPTIREYFGLVKKRYPEIHTLTTAKVPLDPKAMRDLNVDWICPLTSAYHLADADRCRAAGLQVWGYVCVVPPYPYANFLADYPLVESRVFWWQAYQQKLDGVLYWGVNIWDRPNNGKPIDLSRGPRLDFSITTGGDFPWLNGDGRMIYPGPDGPIGSIRLENIRDGLEDYEYLWLLSRKRGSLEAGRTACLPITTDLTHFSRSPERVLRQREVIAEAIGGR